MNLAPATGTNAKNFLRLTCVKWRAIRRKLWLVGHCLHLDEEAGDHEAGDACCPGGEVSLEVAPVDVVHLGPLGLLADEYGDLDQVVQGRVKVCEGPGHLFHYLVGLAVDSGEVVAVVVLEGRCAAEEDKVARLDGAAEG